MQFSRDFVSASKGPKNVSRETSRLSMLCDGFLSTDLKLKRKSLQYFRRVGHECWHRSMGRNRDRWGACGL